MGISGDGSKIHPRFRTSCCCEGEPLACNETPAMLGARDAPVGGCFVHQSRRCGGAKLPSRFDEADIFSRGPSSGLVGRRTIESGKVLPLSTSYDCIIFFRIKTGWMEELGGKISIVLEALGVRC
jgi:hypothetical protein